jgi:hypothetical protein
MLCISGDDYFKKGNIYDVGTIVDRIARKGEYEHGLQAFDFDSNVDLVDNAQINGYPLFVDADRIVNIHVDTDRYADVMVHINERSFDGIVFER